MSDTPDTSPEAVERKARWLASQPRYEGFQRREIEATLRARAEAADAERDRLRYVLEGVRGAIDTGRNEPLMIWRDQINIALAAPSRPD